MSFSYKEMEEKERREAEERQAEEKKALSPLSVSLGIQRLKLNPAIKFIASDSQAGENTEAKRKELANRVQGLALFWEAEYPLPPRWGPAAPSILWVLAAWSLPHSQGPSQFLLSPASLKPSIEGRRLNSVLPNDPGPRRHIATAP